MTAPDPLGSFHPAIAEWFRRRFPAGPTDAQIYGWGPIAKRQDTLIAAPTGSGKTLAAFLVAIDQCLRDKKTESDWRGTSVIYVSPLRALTVDIKENLETPLEEISDLARELGDPLPTLRVAVRNGDTPASARAAMLRDRPEIIVTTPESLYLLLTAQRSRELLSQVDTVIIDEIHAIAKDKRGAHLSLSLERLDALVASHGGRRPMRIGCSATQRPIETVARLLIGSAPDRTRDDGTPRCEIIDVGHRRPLDVAITLTGDELGAVMSIEQLGEIVSSLAEQIRAHRTTLVFVNTRKMSERIAHLLVEELGEDVVAAHHGSLSTERRLSVERRLRAGELAAVVATSSLELGIDVGPVELVCQLGSPRSIATFLQRVGRAEHRRDGVPKGRLYPMSRDELVECVALLGAVHNGDLDTVTPPQAPLDILTQQIVAECASAGEDGVSEDELFSMIRRATSYRSLPRETFDEAVELMSEGVETGRGRRGAYLHRDRVNAILRPRRGARLTASTSGGAIPELADYRVIAEPDEVVVGTVHEDFAVEALIGDVFLLGSTAWRVRRVVNDTVRVTDAAGLAPTIPFWLGEAPARTNELADAISYLYSMIRDMLVGGGVDKAIEAVTTWAQIESSQAGELVSYLATAFSELGTLPTKGELVFERFFDDTGGMQLVIHSPYGARINRGFGLALRKRFCRSFDFELQAAANDDAIVLSLGPQHSFPLDEVPRYLAPASLEETLVQAVLPTPIFTSRWRWNLSRSLVAPRFRGSRHLPFAIQRMEADDLMAAIFPALAACQENVTGPIEIPDHLIVRQTLADCMSEALDLDGLTELITNLRDGSIAARCVDTTEPSILCHEILNGKPFTYLDDAPLEERRTRAVTLRRGIPIEARDLTNLDPQVIEEIALEVRPDPRDQEELHDLLCTVHMMEPTAQFSFMFDALVATGRAMTIRCAPSDGSEPISRWIATERRSNVELLLPDARFDPDHVLDRDGSTDVASREEAIEAIVRGTLEFSAPFTVEELAEAIGVVSASEIAIALASLEASGSVLRVLGDKWCARRLVARIHARQRDRERRSNPAVSPQHYLRFLLDWQHVAPGRKLRDVDGVAEIITQLQGVEIPVGAWEEAVLPSRVLGYQSRLLDDVFARGEATWGRLNARVSESDEVLKRSGATPSRATPLAFFRRDDVSWLLAIQRKEAILDPPRLGATAEIVETLERRGALFFAELCAETGRMPAEIAEALWDGVIQGLVTADSFQAVRALLSGRYRHSSSRRHSREESLRLLRSASAIRRGPARFVVPSTLAGGRWSLLSGAKAEDFEPDELADAIAVQLLERWGIVFRDVVQRERLSVPWREVLFALRRFEARGTVRGGYYVSGFSGEQFALPEALSALRMIASRPTTGERVTISAADPLNLTGIVLPGPRIAAVRGQWITLIDGIPERQESPPLTKLGTFVGR